MSNKYISQTTYNNTAERPPYIEQLRAESRGLPYRPARRKKPEPEPPDPEAARNLFTVCTGKRWMELGEREPEAKMLFGEFWYEGEICILFADTNTGKSALSVQIGTNIALAKATGPFACRAKSASVLYIDFELSTGQFYMRYSDGQSEYNFPGNFFRAQFNSGFEVPTGFKSYDDFIIAGIEYKIKTVNATVLIIDNITCLRGGTESASVALKLMNNLKSLAKQYNLSILVLAHTPKRSQAKPLSADDLHGSKLLINFADSAFTMGKSATDKSLCYLKQIKQRNTRQVYGEDNVCLCRISKEPLSYTSTGNFLHFKFEGSSTESRHLRPSARHNQSTAGRVQLAAKIAGLSAEGLTQRQIAGQLQISVGTVNKIIRG